MSSKDMKNAIEGQINRALSRSIGELLPYTNTAFGHAYSAEVALIRGP